MTAQQEMMKQLVASLEDAARGRGSALANLLAEFSDQAAGRPSREDHARVKAEVGGIRYFYDPSTICISQACLCLAAPSFGHEPCYGNGGRELVVSLLASLDGVRDASDAFCQSHIGRTYLTLI